MATEIVSVGLVSCSNSSRMGFGLKTLASAGCFEPHKYKCEWRKLCHVGMLEWVSEGDMDRPEVFALVVDCLKNSENDAWAWAGELLNRLSCSILRHWTWEPEDMLEWMAGDKASLRQERMNSSPTPSRQAPLAPWVSEP